MDVFEDGYIINSRGHAARQAATFRIRGKGCAMFEKLRMSLRRNVSMAEHMELLAEIYGDSSGFTVEEPLPYEMYRGHGTYFSYGEWVRFSGRFANVLRDK
ncbi:MAG: hypothetical protein L6427_11340, partial [Actinomycetia bacterium]|nr:hypothetical protein [Actinomycetes bacterium]